MYQGSHIINWFQTVFWKIVRTCRNCFSQKFIWFIDLRKNHSKLIDQVTDLVHSINHRRCALRNERLKDLFRVDVISSFCLVIFRYQFRQQNKMYARIIKYKFNRKMVFWLSMKHAILINSRHPMNSDKTLKTANLTNEKFKINLEPLTSKMAAFVACWALRKWWNAAHCVVIIAKVKEPLRKFTFAPVVGWKSVPSANVLLPGKFTLAFVECSVIKWK